MTCEGCGREMTEIETTLVLRYAQCEPCNRAIIITHGYVTEMTMNVGFSDDEAKR